MDKKTWRAGEQRLGPIDHKIGNKMRWIKFYKEKERCQIQKGFKDNWNKGRIGK